MRTETFSTPDQAQLDVRIPAGEVDVATAETDQTHVELEFVGRDADEIERDTRIEARGNEIVVHADDNRRVRDGEYRVRIVTPEGAAVRADLASADIRGRGRYAQIAVDIASGDVEFEQIDGEARVNTASGDVELQRVGAARVNSASGDVRVDDVSGRIEVNTASGDVDLRRVAEGEVKIHSASGDVEVGIAKGSRLWVDAQSLSGETSSELELEAGPTGEDEGPLVELRVQSMSGDISVRRA